MKSRRDRWFVRWTVGGLILGSTALAPMPAYACHSPNGQIEGDVCIAVGDCHILVIPDIHNGISGVIHDPPETGLDDECLRTLLDHPAGEESHEENP